MNAPSIRTLRKRQRAFTQLKQARDLAELVEVPAYQLQLISLKPHYHLFDIPKKDGSKRWIEAPEPRLKFIQRRLNQYLQACYLTHQSPAAYGFMVNAANTRDPRHILTHAQRHLGAKWLLNADMEDFFHSVSWEQVWQIFTGPMFNFEEELATLLTRLCTHRERLTMGAPTSPVLSNFACLGLDATLLELAREKGWTYTRFADDMSFSTTTEMDAPDLARIFAAVGQHGFAINAEKTKRYGPQDTKVVTGLELGPEGVLLPTGFLKELRGEIYKLGHVLEAQHRYGRQSDWVEDYELRIEGMLTFAAFVLGPNAPEVLEAEAQLEAAQQPRDRYSAISWLDFGYF